MPAFIERPDRFFPDILHPVKTVDPGERITYRDYRSNGYVEHIRIECVPGDKATNVYSTDIACARFGPCGCVIEKDGMYFVTALFQNGDGLRLFAKNKNQKEYTLVVSHNGGLPATF